MYQVRYRQVDTHQGGPQSLPQIKNERFRYSMRYEAQFSGKPNVESQNCHSGYRHPSSSPPRTAIHQGGDSFQISGVQLQMAFLVQSHECPPRLTLELRDHL